MKIHIHFDPDKPDEERALMILSDWQRRTGLPPQTILVMALMSLREDPALMASDHDAANDNLDDLRDLLHDVQDHSAATLSEVRHLLDQVRQLLQNGPRMPVDGTDPHPIEAEPPREELPETFVASLKKGVKPGFTLDD